MTPKKIDQIIEFTNTPVALTGAEHNAFTMLRFSGVMSRANIDKYSLYPGQPLAETNEEIGSATPQSLVSKGNRASQKFAELAFSEWPRRVQDIADIPKTQLMVRLKNEYTKKQFCDFKEILIDAENPAKATLLLAHFCLVELGVEVAAKVKQKTSWPQDWRIRTAAAIELFTENNITILISRFEHFYLNAAMSDQNTLQKFYQHNHASFFSDSRHDNGVLSHCPMHGITGKLMMGDGKTASPLPVLYQTLCKLASPQIPVCPFKHGQTKPPESLVPKG